VTFAENRQPDLGSGVVESPRVSMSEPMVPKDDNVVLIAIWKQIMEPTLTYCQAFTKSLLDPPPPVIPLLTMIRLTENAIAEVQIRGCPPLENWLFGLRMQFWPVFQQSMTEHITSLTKLGESSGGGYFRRSVGLSNDAIQSSLDM